MKYRRLGRTNLKVSVIGIGGGAFKGRDKKVSQITEIIRFGIKKGINLVETAEDYDEAKIAPALEGLRDRIILISKSFSSNKKSMEISLRNSLKKLKTDYIDIYMLHTITDKESLEFRIRNGVLDVLKKARSEGKIGFIGLTGHRIPALIEAIETNEFDVVEVPYCICGFASEKLFKVAKSYEVGVIAIRALGGGILINPNKQLKEASTISVRDALAYVLSNKHVSTVLVGMSRIEHVKENVAAVNNGDVSEFERKNIENKVKSFLGQNFCRGCLACMPCDEHGWKFGIDTFMRMEVFYSKYKMDSVIQEYKKMGLNAKSCTRCGSCEAKCPYGVPIIKNLFRLQKIIT